MSLTSAAVRRPVTTLAATLALCLLGAVSLERLPVSLLPDVALPVLTIRTSYPGAAASEVSRLVAEPVEEAIAATPGLVELRSVSRVGEVTTTARFAWGTDMAATTLGVRERLDNARGQLPSEAERPTLLTSDPGERPIAVLAVTGPGDLRSLARTAKEVHARRLEQLDGVASVAVVGGPEDEIRVEVDPDRMRALGLSPQDVAVALQDANASAPGGTIRRGQFRFAVRTLSEFQDLGEIRHTPVGPARSGIVLGDLATVTLTTAEPETMTLLDGKGAVGLVVYKDAGANTVAVTQTMEEVVQELERSFPDVHLTVVAAQARFVNDALSNLVQEIVVGGLLSLLVILVFLKDLRASLAISAMVPLSVLVSLVLLQLWDVTINVLSLGGLALGVGLLVDNAIVVAEAAGTKVEEGMAPEEAAVVGTDEVAAPLIAGTLTTLLVFGPIVFVRGLAAALFRDLSISVVASVGASLILALTLMPVMMRGSRGPKVAGRGSWIGRRMPWLVERLRQADGALGRLGQWLIHYYEICLDWSLDHPKRVVGISVGLTLATVLVTLELPREVLPQVDEGLVVAQMQLPEGTAIEETARQVGRVEEAARALGSSEVYARVGRATDEEILSGAEPGSSATAQLIIPVPDGKDAARFARDLRASVPDLAQGALALDLAGQSEFGSLIGREGRTVRVEVSALVPEVAERYADTVRHALRALGTLADVRDAFAGTQPQVEIQLERDRLAERGISPDAVGDALAGGLGGVKATDFRETDRRTPITVRLAGASNEDLQAALATPVRGIPVSQLVRVKEVRAPVEVVRVDQRPVTMVEAVVERGGTARASAQVTSALHRLTPPAGVTWRVAGADAEQQRTTDELLLVAVLATALVFLVLAGEFASFTVPLLVMLTVPLAAVGGILFLWMTGQSLNAVSLIGIVVMVGLADNEAVVKLEAIRKFRADGHGIREAIHLGSRARLRAIAMTSLTTVTGVLPLLFGWGSGGELYIPLAAGVVGGSVTALAVTFFLLPSMYKVMEERAARKRVAGA
ncbi:MAG TPA: efflux RND transporter permease subunit [Gemmatimonadales bacterium]|nr:efflux RND transporter permease subunit [Gemmatimonadales bacterium]